MPIPTVLILLACAAEPKPPPASEAGPPSEPDAVAPTERGPVTITAVPDAPVRIDAVRIAPVSESTLVTSRPQGDFLEVTFENTSERTVSALALAVRFEDEAGQEVQREPHANRWLDRGYVFHTSGGPATCDPGATCTLGYMGQSVPDVFARAWVAVSSVDLASVVDRRFEDVESWTGSIDGDPWVSSAPDARP